MKNRPKQSKDRRHRWQGDNHRCGEGVGAGDLCQHAEHRGSIRFRWSCTRIPLLN